MEVKIDLLPSQRKFLAHKDDEEFVFCAGIGTGKSFACALWIIQRCLEHGESYLVASQTFTTTKTVQFKAITDTLDFLGLQEGKHYTYNKSDLILEFFNKAVLRGGSSQAPNAVTGATKYDGCWFDESAIFSNEARRYMMGRCRGKRPDGTLIEPKFRYTGSPPIDGHTGWYKDFLLNHPDKCVFASMEEAVGKTLSERYFLNQIELYGGRENPICQAQVFGKVLDDGIGCYVFNKTCWHDFPKVSQGFASMGIDCSGTGRDFNVFTVVDECSILHKRKVQNANVFEMNSIANELVSKYNVRQVCIDTTGGFGSGIADFLDLNKNLEVHRINFSQQATRNGEEGLRGIDNYANARAEMYFKLAQYCRDGFYIDKAEDVLLKELKATTYFINKSGKSQLIEKDSLKEVLGHSPDESDSLALAMYMREYADLRSTEENSYYKPNRTF